MLPPFSVPLEKLFLVWCRPLRGLNEKQGLFKLHKTALQVRNTTINSCTTKHARWLSSLAHIADLPEPSQSASLSSNRLDSVHFSNSVQHAPKNNLNGFPQHTGFTARSLSLCYKRKQTPIFFPVFFKRFKTHTASRSTTIQASYLV